MSHDNFSSSVNHLGSQVSCLVESSRALRHQASEARRNIENVARSLEGLDVTGALTGMRRFAEIVRTGR
jgi:hypothetical protein